MIALTFILSLLLSTSVLATNLPNPDVLHNDTRVIELRFLKGVKLAVSSDQAPTITSPNIQGVLDQFNLNGLYTPELDQNSNSPGDTNPTENSLRNATFVIVLPADSEYEEIGEAFSHLAEVANVNIYNGRAIPCVNSDKIGVILYSQMNSLQFQSLIAGIAPGF